MCAAILTPPPVHAAHLDDEIMALALQLQEIECQSTGQKGKHRADVPRDVDLAFSTFEAEIQRSINMLKDLKCAHSIARAVDADGLAITELAREEAQGVRDRRLAMLLGGQNPDPAHEAPPPYEEAASPEIRYDEFQTAITNTPFLLDSDEENEAGPSMTYAERQRTALESLPHRATNKQCIACADDFPSHQVVQAPCGTVYCKPCLKHLFVLSTKDEGLYPPICHRQEIPLSLIASEMSLDELARFKEARIEFSTSDRTYCSRRACGKFIPPIQILVDKAKCKECGTQTCIHCKNAFHQGDCPNDGALQATLELAEEMGWRRCYKCRSMLELSRGCFHMTCPCGGQFCYLCGVKWKDCRCDIWDENNLINRAEEVVDREANPWQPLARHERERRVQNMREELVENHECDHPGRFQKLECGGRRGFQCEMCDTRHWKFILQCRRCHITLCQECRCNRIR